MKSIGRLILSALCASVLGSTLYIIVGAVIRMPFQGNLLVSAWSILILLPMLLIWLGSGVILGIAAMWVAPALIVGSAIVRLQRSWRPARQWAFWAGVTIIAMLPLIPLVDSVLREAAPPPRENLVAISAAVVAMSLFRAIAPSNFEREPASSNRTSYKLTAAGLLVAAVIAILWRYSYDYRHRFEIRPVEAGMGQATADSTPVELSLNDYSDAGPSKPRYLVTGKSLTFRFPKSYFRETGAQSGGPLRELIISMRKDTLAPLGGVAAQIDYINAERTKAAKELIDRLETTVQLSSIGWLSNGDASHVQRLIKERPDADLGNHCGIHFAAESAAAVSRRSKQGFPASAGLPADHDLRGAMIGTRSEGATGLSCYAHLDECNVEFTYRGFPGTFWLGKPKLCDWRQQTARVTHFLDQHLVQESRPDR